MKKTQRPTSLTNFGISFLLDKHATRFIPYAYSPSTTHNQLTYSQINELPRKIESLYREQPQSVNNYLAAGLAVSLILCLDAVRESLCCQSALCKMSRVGCIGVGITGCLAFLSYKNTERKVQELISKENKQLIEKGLRWYLPKNSQTLELHTDYKFYKTNLSIKDEEIMSRKVDQDRKMFRNPSTINDDEVGKQAKGSKYRLILF